MAKPKLIIIGAGVSGITTALTLQSLGYDTSVFTAEDPNQIANKNHHPELASLFPSASVIPHTVNASTQRLENIFKTSQSFFYDLRKHTFPGITTHKHYEIFEFNKKKPAYCEWMLNWRAIGESDDKFIPRRKSRQSLYGWRFDCIFADWPLYFPALVKCYRQSGGTITLKKLTPDEIGKLPAPIIINCAGAGSPFLFDDPGDEQLLVRGHLLHQPDRPLITNDHGEILSYNYTPGTSVYADLQGNPCDVYCYPRKDGWYIGGSRQTGRLDGDKNWSGEEFRGDSYSIDDLKIPAAIVDLNREILEESYGLSFKITKDTGSMLGYRYIRSAKNGLRLEEETLGNKRVIHNYGHGGAGVTLSWGCALEIAQKMAAKQATETAAQVLKQIEKNI